MAASRTIFTRSSVRLDAFAETAPSTTEAVSELYPGPATTTSPSTKMSFESPEAAAAPPALPQAHGSVLSSASNAACALRETPTPILAARVAAVWTARSRRSRH